MKTIKEELKKEYEKVWTTKKGISDDMVDYCMNKIALFLKTEDGYFYILEKEKLNTKFFISEGSNRSMEEASTICKEIKTKEDFFIEDNLSKINYLINTINNNKNSLFFAAFTTVLRSSVCKISSISAMLSMAFIRATVSIAVSDFDSEEFDLTSDAPPN